MKQCYFFILATIAICITACTKEVPSVEEPQQNIPEEVTSTQEPKTITFGVTMDLGEEASSGAETKASLSGLNINWAGGETIFIANDVNDEIQNCLLTKDPTYPTKGTITVNAVDGATTYYALFTSGTASSDGKVVFDHTAASFSGSEVICRQGELTASKPHRLDLAMAGKTVGENIVMKPCLALVKFRIHANSVAAEYVDGEGYSSVRGFNLMMRRSGSRTNNCGTYSVNLSGSEMAVSAIGEGAKNYKQLSSDTRLSSGTDYYFSVIPVGAIDKIDLEFLGFKWDGEKYVQTWGSDPKDYKMSLEQSLSIDSGDYFNFGTLNPVDLQKAADSFVPAVSIDGIFTDWDGKADLPNTRVGGGTNYAIHSWRMTSDKRNVHIYLKLFSSIVTEGSYVYVGFDTAEGGSSHGGLDGLESYAVVYTCVKASSPVAFVQGVDPRSTVNGSSDGTIKTWGVFGTGEDSDYAFVELTIPRSKVGLSSAGTINVAVAYNYYDTIKQPLTLE